jgi:hypothetical protein
VNGGCGLVTRNSIGSTPPDGHSDSASKIVLFIQRIGIAAPPNFRLRQASPNGEVDAFATAQAVVFTEHLPQVFCEQGMPRVTPRQNRDRLKNTSFMIRKRLK